MKTSSYGMQGLRTLAALCLTLLLTACGGADIKFQTPAKDAVYGSADLIDFDIRFVKTLPADATFKLNGTDVTYQFAVDNTAGTATAQLAASTILDEKNRLEVSTPQVTRTLVFYVDRTGPEFHITNIDPWLMLPGVTVTFSGYVTDLSPINTSGAPGTLPPALWVKTGDASYRSVAPITLNKNNEFSVTYQLEADPSGVVGEFLPLVFRAEDIHRIRSNDAFGSIVNVPQLAKAKVTSNAFANVITPAAETAVNALNLEQLIKARNPVVDKGWSIFSFKLDVTNFELDDLYLNILPTSEGGYQVRANVNAQNLDVSIWSRVLADVYLGTIGVGVPTGLHNADVTGNVLVKFRVDGNPNANPTLVVDHIEPNLNIIGGDFDAIDFGFPIDVPGLGTLEQLIFEAIDSSIAELIGEKVGEKVADKINDQLKLIPTDFDITLRNKTLNFYLMTASVTGDSTGLEVAVTEADALPPVNQRDPSVIREPGYHIHDRSAVLPGFTATTPNGQPFDVGLSLDWDILNKTIHSAHLTGIDKLSTTVAGSSIPKLGTILKNYEMKLDVVPLYSPYLDLPLPRTTPALASVQAKDVQITAQVRRTDIEDTFHPLIQIVANVRADIGLGLSGNRIRVLLDTDPRIDIDSVVKEQSSIVLDEKFIQALVDFAIPKVMPRLADAIQEIRLPTVAGYTLNLLEAENIGNRFFKVYARVQQGNTTGGGGGICCIGGVGGIGDVVLDTELTTQ